MTRTKAILAVVLAVALLAGPATAQDPPTGSADERIAALEELVESQETLIGQQQTLVDEQEALLNAYRCMFKVDVEVVPGGCPDSALSEAEAADAVLLCAGWLAEREDTRQRLAVWTVIAFRLNSGAIAMDNPILQQAAPNLDEYHARVSAVIPNLNSERLAGLMGGMADDLQAMTDAYARQSPATEMAALIFTAIDQLDELDAAIGEICGRFGR